MLIDFGYVLQDCAGAILYSTEKAVEVALEGMQCLGGNGYINGACSPFILPLQLLILSRSLADMYTGTLEDYPMGRILRDSRLYTVGAGTQEIRRMLIGREFNQEFLR